MLCQFLSLWLLWNIKAHLKSYPKEKRTIFLSKKKKEKKSKVKKKNVVPLRYVACYLNLKSEGRFQKTEEGKLKKWHKRRKKLERREGRSRVAVGHRNLILAACKFVFVNICWAGLLKKSSVAVKGREKCFGSCWEDSRGISSQKKKEGRGKWLVSLHVNCQVASVRKINELSRESREGSERLGWW